MLAAVPDVGRVTRRRGRIVLDFSPDLRGSDRYLWSHVGHAFESEAVAESIRQRICHDAARMPLPDAIARYRSQRSKGHRATEVLERFIEAAATTPSERTGQLVRPRTLEAYRAVLRRGRPFWDDLTIGELCQPAELRRLKGWFRLPLEQGGRGLQSDQEARNCFAALRAAVAWYRTTRPDFQAVDWPSMPTALVAKRRNVGRRPAARLTLPQVVAGIDAIPVERQPFFWALFFTQGRPTELRGALGVDYVRPRLTLCRSAESKHRGADVAPTTKTGETGAYELPEWVCDLIEEHCPAARFGSPSPIFLGWRGRSKLELLSDDAIGATWRKATEKAGIPWVPVYRAMKHTQVSALLDAGISVDELVTQCRWTSPAMLEHYDEARDVRRGRVVAKLAELVGPRTKGDQ